MGDLNQLYFTEKFKNKFLGPVLEIGSKDYGNTMNLRSLFPVKEYVGVDLEAGRGVDVVLDMTEKFSKINKKLGFRRFKTIVCYSVLEHCSQPFILAENISKLLDKNGVLLISVPFAWRVHGYPSDYWRFTNEGIKVLFPEIYFDPSNSYISTCIPGEIKKYDDYMFRAELTINKSFELKHYGVISAAFIYLFRKLKIFPYIFKYPHLFPSSMINMMGIKKNNG